MKRRTRPTMFEIAMRRSKSMRTSMMALEYVIEWGRATDKLGRELDAEEYGEHVGISRSQAFRRQAAFRKCFPSDDLATLWGIMRPVLERNGYDASRSTLSQAVYLGTITAGLKKAP